MQRILFLFLLSCFAIKVHAQTGIWSSVGIDFKYNKKLESNIQVIHRYNQVGWAKSGISLSEFFSPKKFIVLGLQYRWSLLPNEQIYLTESPFDSGNRAQFSADWKVVRSKKKENRFEISWRNAIQLERLNGQQNPLIFRSRINLSSPVWQKMRLSTKVEYFYWSNAIQYRNDNELIQYGLSKEWRYSAAWECKINPQNKINIGYCYSNRLLKQDRQWFTIGINHDLKRKQKGGTNKESMPSPE